MEEKKNKRQQQATETRERIIQSALELFREKNHEDITIADICGAAGISNGNFYHYFSSKDSVYLFLIEEMDEQLEKEFDLGYMDRPLEGISVLIRNRIKRAQAWESTDKHLYMLGVMIKSRSKNCGEFPIKGETIFVQRLRLLVDKALEMGEIHPSHEPEQVVRAILQIFRGTVFDYNIQDEPYMVEEQTEAVLQLLFTALRLPREE